MVTVSSRPTKYPTDAGLARLKATCKRLGITHDRIAAEAGVTRSMVVNVLSSPPRAKSANVVAAIRRLIADAKATPPNIEKVEKVEKVERAG